MIGKSRTEARDRVWDLSEPEGVGHDLPAALEAMARERTVGTGIDFSMTEDAALRIAREAIANALRHAEPRHIELVLEFAATTLRMEVRDDGLGFTPQHAEDARRNGHFGLSGIRPPAHPPDHWPTPCQFAPSFDGAPPRASTSRRPKALCRMRLRPLEGYG